MLTKKFFNEIKFTQIAPVGVSTFFVENIKEMQLSAIRLTTCLFSKYEKHRKHIMDEIFQSMSRLPTSKRNLRSFKYINKQVFIFY